MQTDKQPQEETTSFGKIEEAIQVNQTLYDRLHESLVEEAVTTVEEEKNVQVNEEQSVKREELLQKQRGCADSSLSLSRP